MATLNNFTITSAQNQDILIYSNGSWINSNISGFFGILDGRYSANTHNHDGRYILKADAYTKSQTYPAASLYTKAEIDAMFDGFDPGSGGGGGSGLVNSASNVGSGAGVFHANASGDLQFRSLFSQDIDLLTITVSGTSVVLTPKVPTWSKLVSANGQLTTSHVNFANQALNTSSSPTFNNGTFTGELKVENAQPLVRLNDTTGNNVRIRNQSSIVYFDAGDGSGNATVALGNLRTGTAFIGSADGPFLYRSNATDHTFVIRTGTPDAYSFYTFEGSNATFRVGGNKVWHEGNDGAGSGLNADLLDGYHESTFARKPGDHTTNNTEYSMVWENNGGVLYTSSAHLKYNPGLRRLTVPSILSDTINLGSSTPVELTRYSNGILGINSPSGFVNIGANNTGYAHLYTDRDQFYFSKGIQVDGYIKVYNKQSQFTADGNHVLVGPTSASFVRVSNNGDITRKNTSWSNNSGEQKILRCDWVGNIGDYLQLQPAGNRSSNGTLSIGTNGFAVGLHDLNGPEADVRIPFTDTWMSVNTTDFWLSGKRVIRHSDNWLRFNEDKSFSDGIYCGDSTLRTDGNLQVGSAGSAFNASTGQIDLKVTTRVYNKLHVREIVSQDGNFTTIGAGELGNSLRDHVIDTLGVGNEGLHIGGENGVYVYSHPNNMTGGLDSGYSIRVLAPDGASYLNHLDVYKSQNNSNQVMARFRHPIHNGSIALVSKNNDAGSFRFEANMEGQDLRIQTCDTSGNYFTSGISVGTIARFFRDGDVSITREVTAQDFIATSDIRVKENLERIDSSLDKIAKLTGFTYDQVKLKQRKAGLIAQEVKEVLPEAVGEDKDGMLNVSPMAVLALLVNAVNDLAKEVKELKI